MDADKDTWVIYYDTPLETKIKIRCNLI